MSRNERVSLVYTTPQSTQKYALRIFHEPRQDKDPRIVVVPWHTRPFDYKNTEGWHRTTHPAVCTTFTMFDVLVGEIGCLSGPSRELYNLIASPDVSVPVPDRTKQRLTSALLEVDAYVEEAAAATRTKLVFLETPFAPFSEQRFKGMREEEISRRDVLKRYVFR